mmetsp:Transcript_15753/g.26340  ORF Transcript_15753/g.26340 Transcript_15753/m.26340 type:complete len:228 (-) Transcript_15753:1492-2175(-)
MLRSFRSAGLLLRLESILCTVCTAVWARAWSCSPRLSSMAKASSTSATNSSMSSMSISSCCCCCSTSVSSPSPPSPNSSSNAGGISDRPIRTSSMCLASTFAIPLADPPSKMSVPRPAMLVLTVTAPTRPAWETISLSRSTFSGRALSTFAFTPRSVSACATSSDASTEVVPIKIGLPFSCVLSTFFNIAFIFPSCVLNTASGLSRRAIGSAVGMGMVFSWYVSKNS